MSAVVISLLFSVGTSTWLYTKLQRYSGNNSKQSAIATGVAGLIIFFILWSILNLIF